MYNMSKMSYRKKPYRDKRNLPLAESERLRQDIEELEDALILHTRFRSKDENSVKGMIRKEIGGSRWQHGGVGRLTTYRSERDLVDQTSRETSGRHGATQTRKRQQKMSSRGDIGGTSRDTVNNTGHRSKTAKGGAGTLREIMDNKKQLEKQRETTSSTGRKESKLTEQPQLEVTCVKAEWGQVEREESPMSRGVSPVGNEDASKTVINTQNASQSMDISDLKNKVLAKASSKVIDRKNFSAKSTLDSGGELRRNGRSNYDSISKKKKAGSHIMTQRGDGDPDSGKYLNLDVLDSSSDVLYKTTGAKSRKDSQSHKFDESLNPNVHKMNSNQDNDDHANKQIILRESKYDSPTKSKSLMSGNVDVYFESGKWADSRGTSQLPKEFDFQKFQRRNSYSSDNQRKMTTDSLDKSHRKSTPSTTVSLICQSAKTSHTSNRSPQEHRSSNPSKGYNPTSKVSDVSISRESVSFQSPSTVTDTFITNPTYPGLFVTSGSALPTSTAIQTYSSRVLYNSMLSSIPDKTNSSHSPLDLLSEHSDQQQLSIADSRQEYQTSQESKSKPSATVHYIPAGQPSDDVEPVQLQCIKSKEDSEVEAWLHNLCLQSVDHYAKLFSDHQMDMASVRLLTANGLRDMGINALGPIMKIMKGVQVLNRDERSLDGNTCESSFEYNDKLAECNWNTSHTSVTEEQNETTDTRVKNNNPVKGVLDSTSFSDKEKQGPKVAANEKELKATDNSEKKSQGCTGANMDPRAQMSLSNLTGWKQTSEEADYANLKDRSPVANMNVPENFLVKEKFKQKKRQSQPVKRSLSAKVKGKSAGSRIIGKPPAVSKNVEDGISMAAEKFSNKLQQQRLKEEVEERSAARQKQMRDEMAAKHVRRRSSSLDRNNQRRDTDRSLRSSLERSSSFTTVHGAFEMSPRASSRSSGVESVLSTRALPVKKKSKGDNRLSERQQLDKASQNAISEMDEIIASLRSTPDTETAVMRKSRTSNQDLTLGAVHDMQKQLSHIEQRLTLGTSENQHFQQHGNERPHQRELSASASFNSEEDSSPRPSARGRKSAREWRRHRAAMGWGADEENEGLALSASFSAQPDGSNDVSISVQQSSSVSQPVNKQRTSSTEPSVVNLSLLNNSDASTIPGTDGGFEQGSSQFTGANIRAGLVGSKQRARIDKETGKAAVTMTTTATAATVPHVNRPVEFDFSPLRNQSRKDEIHHLRQSVRPSKANLGAIYHLENIKKVELDRTDINFSEKDLLGDGAFSQVFKGTYQGSEVAVKRLKAPLQTIDTNYFIAEVSMLQELRHPHVVMLMGVCSTDNLPLMVIEFLACGNLHTLLHDSDRPALDSKDFCQIAHDVSAGMMYLHKHKPPVLHLDLKPRNVLIGHGMRAKVADFGFSKLKHEADMKVSRASKSRIVKGTPAWMAPELLAAGEITAKADVYSFGVVLWEMLTRQVPYEGCTVFQVLELVRVNRRPSIPLDCPRSLSQLIQKCWDQNPAARPAFKEVIKSLEQLSESSGWNVPGDFSAIQEDPVRSIDLSDQNVPFHDSNKTPRSVRRPEVSEHSEWIPLEIKSFSSHGEDSDTDDDDTSGNSTDDKSVDSLSTENSKQVPFNIVTEESQNTKSGMRENGKNPKASSSHATIDIPTGIASHRHNASPRQSTASSVKEEQDSAQKLIAKYLPHTKSRNSVSKSHDAQPSLPAHGKLLPLRHSVDRPKAAKSFNKDKMIPVDQKIVEPEKNGSQKAHSADDSRDGNSSGQIRLSRDGSRTPSTSQTENAGKKSSNDSVDLTMVTPSSHFDIHSYISSIHGELQPTKRKDLKLKRSLTASVDVPTGHKDKRHEPGPSTSSQSMNVDSTSHFMRSLNKAYSGSPSGVVLNKQSTVVDKAQSGTQRNSNEDRNYYGKRNAPKSKDTSNTFGNEKSRENVKSPNSISDNLSKIASNNLSSEDIENTPTNHSVREDCDKLLVLSQTTKKPVNNDASQWHDRRTHNHLQSEIPTLQNAGSMTKCEGEIQRNTHSLAKPDNYPSTRPCMKSDVSRMKQKSDHTLEKSQCQSKVQGVDVMHKSNKQVSSFNVKKHQVDPSTVSYSQKTNGDSDSETSSIPDDISEDSLSPGNEEDDTCSFVEETPSTTATKSLHYTAESIGETSYCVTKDIAFSKHRPKQESSNRNRESFFLFHQSDTVESFNHTESTSVWNIDRKTSSDQNFESSTLVSHENNQIGPNQKARNARRNTSVDGQPQKQDRDAPHTLQTQAKIQHKPAISLTTTLHQELLCKTRPATESNEVNVSLTEKSLNQAQTGVTGNENKPTQPTNQCKPSHSSHTPSHSSKSVSSNQKMHLKDGNFHVTDSLLAKGKKLLKPAEKSLPSQDVKSTGVTSFSIEASMLVKKKGQLRSVATKEPPPIWEMTENAEEENLPSMASILKKAMTDRRFAMGDNHESADLTPEASWSIQEEDH